MSEMPLSLFKACLLSNAEHEARQWASHERLAGRFPSFEEIQAVKNAAIQKVEDDPRFKDVQPSPIPAP